MYVSDNPKQTFCIFSHSVKISLSLEYEFCFLTRWWFEKIEVTRSGLHMLFLDVNCKVERWRSEVLNTLWVPRFGRQFNTAWARPGFFSFPSLNKRTGIRDGTCRYRVHLSLDEGNKTRIGVKHFCTYFYFRTMRKSVFSTWEPSGDRNKASKIVLKRGNILGTYA